MIDQKLAELRNSAAVPLLPEIPTDQAVLPPDWLALVSWNVQVGGVSTAADAPRPPLVAAALGRLFSGNYQILAAQEVSSTANSEVLRSLLPGGPGNWAASFFDTNDTQDNGFWYRLSALTDSVQPLFVTSMMDASGRIIVDPERSLHPPQVAHFTVGNFDFTLITVHLTFADGDTAESAREMRVVLDYLDEYFQQPGHDPDVIICGDFNTPSLLSGQSGSAGITLDSVFDGDARFQTGERRFVVTVHEPTSRNSAANGGMPVNNYDHFVFSADVLEELIQARRVAPEILTADPADPEERLTSDHFPVVAFFRTQGEGIDRDVDPTLMTINAVVSGASFEPGLSAGSWVTIFGSNLAPSTRVWRDDEIVGGVLPTSLDGVRVSINGRPAAVYFISPKQLNVQSPEDGALGSVIVEVVRGDGTRALAMADLRAASPGLFTFDPENRRYLAAVHADGVYVGKAGLFGDAVPSRPAEPGDLILLFGTGFGATNPAVPAGQVFSGAAPLANWTRVFFGGVEAAVSFAGLSGAGLDQLNVVVPEVLPNGDVEVTAQVLGMSTQAGTFVTIKSPFAPPAPLVSFIAQPDSIMRGESSTLQWNTQNATSAELSPGIGAVAVNGSVIVMPASTTTYRLTVRGDGGEASTSITVTVREPAPAPSLTFTATPQTIVKGESSTLRWTSQNATSATLTPATGEVAVNGSQVVTPTTTTTYTLTATGPGGTTSRSLTVTVNAIPAPGVTLTASPQTIQAGQSTTLQWTSNNATTVSISPSIGPVSANGSLMLTPTQTTTYTITAQGPGGSSSASVTVIVTQSTFGPCGSKTTCGQMTSCAEAMYYLNTCKVTSLDGDKDGVPCESICPGG